MSSFTTPLLGELPEVQMGQSDVNAEEAQKSIVDVRHDAGGLGDASQWPNQPQDEHELPAARTESASVRLEAAAAIASQDFTNDEAEDRKQTLARQAYWTEAKLAALNKQALKRFDRVVYSFLGLSMRIDLYDDSDGLGWGWGEAPSADCVQLDDGYNGLYGVNRATGTWGQDGEVWNHGDMISLTEKVFGIYDRLEAASRLGGYLNSPWERRRTEVVRILIVCPKNKANPVPRPVGLGTNFLTWLSRRIDDRIANPAPEGHQQ
jgi:hypothetical protein